MDHLRRGLRSQGGLAGRSRPSLVNLRSKGNTQPRGTGVENSCDTEQARRQRYVENMELIGQLVAKSQKGAKSRRTTVALNTDKTGDLENNSKVEEGSVGTKSNHVLMSPKVVQPSFASGVGFDGAGLKSPLVETVSGQIELLTSSADFQNKLIQRKRAEHEARFREYQARTFYGLD